MRWLIAGLGGDWWLGSQLFTRTVRWLNAGDRWLGSGGQERVREDVWWLSSGMAGEWVRKNEGMVNGLGKKTMNSVPLPEQIFQKNKN